MKHLARVVCLFGGLGMCLGVLPACGVSWPSSATGDSSASLTASDREKSQPTQVEPDTRVVAQASASLSSLRPSYLIDPSTQMAVEQYKVPSGWSSYGKVEWHPEKKDNFVVWASNFVDGTTGGRAKIGSGVVLSGMTQAIEAKLLGNPQGTAELFLGDVREILPGVSNYQLINANYAKKDLDVVKQLQQAMKQLPQVGNYRGLMFTAEWRCTYKGQEWKVMAFTPLAAFDSLAGGMKLTTVQLILPSVYAAPAKTFASFDKQLGQVVSTRAVNPAWTKMRDDIYMRIMQANIENSRALRETLARNQQEIRDMQMDTYRQASSLNDKVADQWSQVIREVDEVSNPFDSSQSVVVSTKRNHAWMNSAKQVFYTDSSTVDPNTNDSMNQSEWKRVK